MNCHRNLLHNAIKYSPEDGALSVRLEALDQFAQLTIRDSGQGISPELQERLFQPFSAGDIRTGSGLGLAICLEVVKALNGTITLTNRYENEPKLRSKVIGLDTVVRLPLQRLLKQLNAVAQAAQIQAKLRFSGGTRASKSASNLTAVHQHGSVCLMPVSRSISIAHWLICPHRGHILAVAGVFIAYIAIYFVAIFSFSSS